MLKSKSVNGVCWRAIIMLYLIIHISLNVSMILDFRILGGLDIYIIPASAIIISILLCKKNSELMQNFCNQKEKKYAIISILAIIVYYGIFYTEGWIIAMDISGAIYQILGFDLLSYFFFVCFPISLVIIFSYTYFAKLKKIRSNKKLTINKN
ncbi:hypothetical protein AN642_00635 [Epulopiscium sp. SCG-B10WGA-EpuloA2]|nr:hypothetical protein AN642_00635 [Epulopiscium sp. SCG-B10WGA-EpuloA2]